MNDARLRAPQAACADSENLKLALSSIEHSNFSCRSGHLPNILIQKCINAIKRWISGTHLLDGSVGDVFLGDYMRTHRDLLGNAAKQTSLACCPNKVCMTPKSNLRTVWDRIVSKQEVMPPRLACAGAYLFRRQRICSFRMAVPPWSLFAFPVVLAANSKNTRSPRRR
jgi:hypothetical protein